MASISISNLSFTYEGSSEAVFSSLTLQLDSDWRLGLIGRNGRGISQGGGCRAGTPGGPGSHLLLRF